MEQAPQENQPIYSYEYRSAMAEQGGFLTDFSMRSFQAGQFLYSKGKHAHAIMAFQYGLMRDPNEIRLHFMLIVSYLGLGKTAEAAAQLRILQQTVKSDEELDSIQASLEKWGYIPNSGRDLPWTSSHEPPLLTCSLFGIAGAFGNQIFQYAFLRIYAEKYGLKFEVNDWPGRKLFDLQDPEISHVLPFILELEYYRNDVFSVPPNVTGLCNRDTQGYFQYNTLSYLPYREKFTSFFQPNSRVNWVMQPFLQDVRRRGKTLVAIHIRLTDAALHGRPVSAQIYLEWLKEIWPTLESPILFLASDDLNAVRNEFTDFHPVTTEGVRFPVPDAKYYPDFFMLTQADVLAAGNSTFSFAASMLNERAKVFLRPGVGNQKLEPYDPWGSTPTL